MICLVGRRTRSFVSACKAHALMYLYYLRAYMHGQSVPTEGTDLRPFCGSIVNQLFILRLRL